MKLPGCVCLTLLVVNLVDPGNCCEIVTVTFGVICATGSMLALHLWESVRCLLAPSCNNRGIKQDVTDLKTFMQRSVYGQHLASSTVPQYIEEHLKSENPHKALVLSFHGPVGVGKTFVSKAIAENIYQDGLQGRFVHRFSAVKDFPHRNQLRVYQNQLQAWVKGNVTEYDKSLFIFEEFDKLPSGLFDVLVPSFEYSKDSGRPNYNKAIFILLSNIGSSNILRATFDHIKSGKDRETLGHSDLKNVILQAVDEDTEYSKSLLKNRNMVSAYVPFLPLENLHVTMCIQDAIQTRQQSSNCPQDQILVKVNTGRHESKRCASHQELIDDTMKSLTFSPKEEPIFSEFGCKKAVQKIREVTHFH